MKFKKEEERKYKNVKIDSFRINQDSIMSKQYIIYKIKVNEDKFVERRYSDFLKLHYILN
jgi:hypothetical protein